MAIYKVFYICLSSSSCSIFTLVSGEVILPECKVYSKRPGRTHLWKLNRQIETDLANQRLGKPGIRQNLMYL
nr:hypothetical protein Q903MT_gene183 [Picea sitchensis]